MNYVKSNYQYFRSRKSILSLIIVMYSLLLSFVSRCSNLMASKFIKNSQRSILKDYHKKILFLAIILIPLHSFSQTSGFTIPPSHPRLWWNTERVAKAKNWYQTHSFTPANDDPFGCAFRYVLTGEKTYAAKAITWLMDKRLPAGQVLPTAIGCDDCRWSGEYANVVFDWCYNEMTDAQRNEIIARWNKYYSDVNQQDWGGVGMEGNNYYWGNLRNSVEWGIATFHHNTSAQSFLDHGLKTRWENSFIPYAANSTAKGGALGEGPLYGCTMLDYPIIPFSSVNLLGRNIYEESNFYKEALVNIIYSTTPAPIINGSDQYYDFFPYNESDVEDFLHAREYFGNFMTVAANQWKDEPLGQYAKKWLGLTTANVADYIASINVTTITTKEFTTLPLDYYSSGLGLLSARTDWTTNATAIQIQMKDPEGVGHTHADWSSFQMFRKGRWLTKETSGYSDLIKGVNSGSNVDTDVNEADAHNTIFIGKTGDMKSLVGYWQLEHPDVTRLESKENYVFAALDLTGSFKTSRPDVASLYNPFVENVVREYIFIRPLETLIVFDRLKSKTSGSTNASDVMKTALIHFQTNPKLEDANHVLVTVGGQALHLSTVLPSNPTYNVVNEGGNVGQFRLQISTKGEEQSYMLNVLQVRDATGNNLTTKIQEVGNAFVVTITHPNLGSSIISLEKGALSSGGKIGYSSAGIPTVLTDFTTSVQTVNVTNDGPVWATGTTTSGIENGVVENDLFQLQVYPNPASTLVDISFNLSKRTTTLTLSIYKSDGQFIKSYTQNEVEKGVKKLNWNTQEVASGVYFLKLQTEYGAVSERIVVVK